MNKRIIQIFFLVSVTEAVVKRIIGLFDPTQTKNKVKLQSTVTETDHLYFFV